MTERYYFADYNLERRCFEVGMCKDADNGEAVMSPGIGLPYVKKVNEHMVQVTPEEAFEFYRLYVIVRPLPPYEVAVNFE